ncbi:MAG: AI-2E family transporter [Bdellovibrionaceae bacterium]|nr:AI-2E family transporter [Bdellovibrio sp.]
MINNKKTEISLQHYALHLPMKTIFRILAVILIVSCLKTVGTLLMILFLATLLAVSLAPVARWMQSKGLSKNWSIVLIAFVLGASVLSIIAFIIPQLFTELTNFLGKWPEYRDQLLSHMHSTNPLKPMVEQSLDKKMMIPKPSDMMPIFNAGSSVLEAFTQLFLVLVFAVYLIAYGEGVINWISAFFSTDTQKKLNQTFTEIYDIIFAYVAGQFITSLLSFAYVFAVLSFLQVPSALLLATLSGIFDVLPVLGFFLAVIPAMLFAFSVSGTTAALVFVLYLVYHAIESYYIVPLVYGHRLRVSSFVVLVSLIAAGLLAGIAGAIAVLPVIASYPIIERIWLKKIVGSATIADHESAQEGETLKS